MDEYLSADWSNQHLITRTDGVQIPLKFNCHYSIIKFVAMDGY